MGKLIRMDRSGHTTLAEWTADDDAALARAASAFEKELERGMIASANSRVVRELPAEADLVVLRRQIAGG